MSRLTTTTAGHANPKRQTTSDLPQLNVPAGRLDETFIPTISRIRLLDDHPAYETLDVEAAAELLYQLDPDALLTNVPTDYDDEIPDMEMTVRRTAFGSATRALQLEMGSPACIHVGYDYGSDDRQWYNTLPEEERFKWPDGSVVEDFFALAGETLNGSPHGKPGEWIIPSPFAAGTVELLSEPATTFLDDGFSLVNFDFTNAPRLEGLDFSRWATAAFQAFLKKQPPDRLDAWGIDDPDTFDMRTYLRSNDLTPRHTDTPAKDPVVREYTLIDHQALLDLWHTVTDRVTSRKYPAPEIGTFPNAAPLWNAPVAGIYLHDAFDVVGFEEKVPTVPPDSIRDSLYKLALAAGRFDKLPVDHEAALPPAAIDELGFDLDVRYTTLMRLQAAEAYAMGGRLALNLFVTAGGREFWENPERQPIRWVNTDGTIPEELPPFIDFCLAHRRFLEDVTPANRVAVIYSLPTMLWNTFPQWGQQPTAYQDSFEGVAALLRENGYAYDVTVFGHPRLWEDPDQRDQLTSYDTVVLPNAEAITDEQVSQLRTLLESGVHVIVSGTPPDRTGMYESRSDAETLLRDHANATVLESDPGRQRMAEGSEGGEFRDTLERTTRRQVEVSTGAHIGVNVLEQTSPERQVIHLLNYEYTVENDAVTTQEDITVLLRNLSVDPGVARWYTEDGVDELTIEQAPDGVEVTIPSLDIWGFIVVGADESVLHPGDADAAETAMETAASAVETARQADRTRDLYHAEHGLSNARAMLEYDAYKQGQKWAERATAQADAAYARPTIGIDVGHGQPTSGTGYDRFKPIRTLFDDFEYRAVDALTDQHLSEVDVLIIPPAYTWKNAEYGFETGEIKRVQRFVSAGGSLLVLGHAGMARDVNALLSVFEMPVSDKMVIGKASKAEAVLSPLTLGVNRFEADAVTPVVNPPRTARVLASMPDETAAWYHRDAPKDERSADEQSAAGAPVYVIRPWGEGLVAYLGSIDAYAKDEVEAFNLDAKNLVDNSLAVLGRHARLSKQASAGETPTSTTTMATATSTSTTTATATPPSTPATTATGAPGFTALTGLLGGGAGLVAYWLWQSKGEDES